VRSSGTPILIVDDHPIFRLGLATVLASRGFTSVSVSDGTVTDAAALTPDGVGSQPWVALLDVRLGAIDGIRVCQRLRSSPHPPVVIMLTTYEEPAVVQAAKDAGAFAFLSKEADVEEIVATIEQGLRGADPRIPDQDLPTLTPREREVLGLLREGLDNKSMAQRLGIGTATVKDHLDNLYGKLGVSDRLGAVRVASALGLIDKLGS
jgi:two-component system, NarL family, nitrate/nitrite response regulator NarL